MTRGDVRYCVSCSQKQKDSLVFRRRCFECDRNSIYCFSNSLGFILTDRSKCVTCHVDSGYRDMTGTALQRVPTMATFLQTTLFQRSRPVFNICRLSAHSRNFVTDHPRPEPVVETFAGPSKYRRNGSAKKHLRGHSSLSQPSHSTPTSSKTSVETFSDPARPQPYYAKHPPFRDLPRPKV